MKKQGLFPFCVLFFLFLAALSGTRPAFCSGNSRNEEVRIVTDRQVYVAGETVLFRLFHFFDGRLFEETGFIYLVLKNLPGENVLELTYRFTGGDSYGSFYLPDTLGTGAYQLFAFSDAMHRMHGLHLQPVNLLVLNRFDESLEGLTFSASKPQDGESRSNQSSPGNTENIVLETNKEKFSRRERVKLDIKNPSEWLDVSVTVARNETFFPGNFSPEGVLSATVADDLQWPHFREKEEYLLSGRLNDREGGEAIQGARVLLSKPDTILNLLYAETDSKGRFVFSLSEYFSGSELYLHLFENNLPQRPVITLDEKWDVALADLSFPNEFDQGLKAFFDLMREAVGVSKAYKVAFGASASEYTDSSKAKEPRVYSRPTHTYLLNEYEPLDDLQEIARELIPYLRIRRQAQDFSVRIMDQNQSYSFFNKPPMIFLDAVPVENITTLVDLNSSQLSRIEVVSFPWRFGHLEFDGILALFSQHKENVLPERSNPIKVVNFPEVHPASRFVIPDYSLGNDRLKRIPDFRHTLYWEPRLEIDKGESTQVTFFTGDLPGSYTIYVRGVTKDGKNIRQTKTIKVEL
jgi:hypothetical protein